ncbi:MAG: hypothetical protein NC081_10160 [Roseburia sp.]|nr:hypothetical protein [Roseburia sp.]
MKNKAQTVFFCFTILGILLSVIAYMYYYSPTKEKTEELVASNKTLKERVDELEVFYNEMPANQEKIEEWTESIQSMLAVFPCDIKEEDTIYLALRTMNLDALKERYQAGEIQAQNRLTYSPLADMAGLMVKYNAIEIGEREDLASIEEELVKNAAIEGLEQGIYLVQRTVSYQNLTSYDNMKCMIQSINTEPDRMAITNFVYNVTEEGNLDGTVTVTFYAASGTGREYEPKQFADYPLGLKNIFIQSR